MTEDVYMGGGLGLSVLFLALVIAAAVVIVARRLAHKTKSDLMEEVRKSVREATRSARRRTAAPDEPLEKRERDAVMSAAKETVLSELTADKLDAVKDRFADADDWISRQIETAYWDEAPAAEKGEQRIAGAGVPNAEDEDGKSEDEDPKPADESETAPETVDGTPDADSENSDSETAEEAGEPATETDAEKTEEPTGEIKAENVDSEENGDSKPDFQETPSLNAEAAENPKDDESKPQISEEKAAEPASETAGSEKASSDEPKSETAAIYSNSEGDETAAAIMGGRLSVTWIARKEGFPQKATMILDENQTRCLFSVLGCDKKSDKNKLKSLKSRFSIYRHGAYAEIKRTCTENGIGFDEIM